MTDNDELYRIECTGITGRRILSNWMDRDTALRRKETLERMGIRDAVILYDPVDSNGDSKKGAPEPL